MASHGAAAPTLGHPARSRNCRVLGAHIADTCAEFLDSLAMSRLLPLLLVLGASASGCVVRHAHSAPAPYASQQSNLKSGKQSGCHPSQYWDGEQCRHKGKGHGARKHDG